MPDSPTPHTDHATLRQKLPASPALGIAIARKTPRIKVIDQVLLAIDFALVPPPESSIFFACVSIEFSIEGYFTGVFEMKGSRAICSSIPGSIIFRETVVLNECKLPSV